MRFISAQILLAFIAICVAFVTASALPEPDALEIRQATNASAAAASSSSSVSAAEATGSGYPGGVATGSTGGGDTGGLGNTPNGQGTGTTSGTNGANSVGHSAASVNAPSAWTSSLVVAGLVGTLAFLA